MSDHQIIEEFYDARFGLFIHWGLYSILGGEWQEQRMSSIGEWIMSYHKIPIVEYEKLANRFDPINFNAEAIVLIARAAGMKYIVITSKHHDGFALFKSEADPYNVVDATPFGRDIIAELSAACKKHKMKFGLYYSQALDWHERNAGGWDDPQLISNRQPWANVWDFPGHTGKNFEEYFSCKVLPQVTELLTNYGDIFLMWFDTPRTISHEQSERLYRLVKDLQPNCLVNSRIGNDHGDYMSLGDNQLPTVPLSFPAESPVTLNDTWGYKHYDDHWKDSRDIIDKLIRLASKNVNFLLNIGPRGDGSVPEETIQILSETGQWLAANGEAIRQTRGNPYLHDFHWGSVTSRDNRLYFFIDDAARTSLSLNGLLTPVKRITSLVSGEPISFTQSESNLQLTLLPSASYRPVYRVELDDKPRFTMITIDQEGGILSLYPHLAKLQREGRTQVIARHKFGDRHRNLRNLAIECSGTLVNWTDRDDVLLWEAVLTQPGYYKAEIYTPVSHNQPPSPVAHQLEMMIDGEEGKICFSGIISNGVTSGGTIHIATAGYKHITLRVTATEGKNGVSLQCVRLVRNLPY